MLCPSISLNTFDESLGDQTPCTCKMARCECCKPYPFIKPKVDVIPRPNDVWTLPPGVKRHMYNRSKDACVTILRKHTSQAIAKLLKAGIGCLHFPLANGTREENEQVALRIRTEIASHHLRCPGAGEVTLAIEIRGRVVRTGRNRNDKPFELTKGNQVFVTANTEYELCSTKDVIFIQNLEAYLKRIQVGEFIFINRHDIQLVVAKVTYTTQTLTCCVVRGSCLESYSPVILPYLITGGPDLSQAEQDDCEFVKSFLADYVVVPTVSDAQYVSSLRLAINHGCNSIIGLLSQLDETYFETDLTNIESIVNASDGIWFSRTPKKLTKFVSCTIATAREFGVPVIMALHQKMCDIPASFWYDCDCYLLSRFDKYIGKSLLHEVDVYFKSVIPEENDRLKDAITNTNKVLSVMLGCASLTRLLLQAQIVLCISRNGEIAMRISQLRPACPIITIVGDRKLSRSLNIYKNILPIICIDQSADDYSSTAVRAKFEFGINEAKKLGLIVAGDLILKCCDQTASENQDALQDAKISYSIKYIS